MPDRLLRAIIPDRKVRCVAAVATGLVAESCRRHATSVTASVALGRALTGAALLSALLKGKQQLGLRFAGDGPLGRIVVEVDADGAARGYVQNPQAEPGPRDGRIAVGEGVGRTGMLTVIRQLDGPGSEPYTSQVPLVNGEIGADLAHYLTQSEQVPSAVGVGVRLGADGRVRRAAGFMLQALPGCDPATIDALSAKVREAPAVTDLLPRGKGPAHLLGNLLGPDLAFDTLEERALIHRCLCSRDKMAGALAALGREALSDLILDRGQAELECHYCREKQVFEREELARILARLAEPEPPA